MRTSSSSPLRGVRKGVIGRECRRAGFGASSPTRFCFTSDCSWKRARNATCFKPVAVAFCFVFFPRHGGERRSKAVRTSERLCFVFFYLPVTERRRAKIASCRQSGRSAETKWKWDCMYKSIFKRFHEWWLLVYIPRSCKSSGNSE